MLDHFFPLLFPKDSESVKIFDIQLREVGAKRPLNGTSKVNRQTDRQTHGQTDRRTLVLVQQQHHHQQQQQQPPHRILQRTILQ